MKLETQKQAEQLAIVMAFEAFRMAIGQPPLKYTPRQVMQWLGLVNHEALKETK